MKTIISAENEKWWFKWENRAGDISLAGAAEGPFNTKAEAEQERNDFVNARKAKYPHGCIEV